MSKTVRGWEKPKAVVASAPTASTPIVTAVASPPKIDIHSIVKGFSRDDAQAHRQAYMHLMQSLTGTAVDIDVTDGRSVAGVFYTATPFRNEQQRVVLKTARILKSGATDGQDTTEPLSTIFSDFKDIVVVRTAKLNLQTKNYNHEFATDSTIKKHGDMSSLDGRTLQNVSSSWLDPTTDTSLGTTTTADGKQWDQFAANKQLFNVNSSYDENLYTKKLDMSKMSREQIAHADRMAREIEGTTSTNIHMRQERGQAMEEEISEEDLFSGVLTRPAAAPVKENAWSRGAKINFNKDSTVPVPGPPGVGAKGNKGASSPASKTRPVPGATAVPPVAVASVPSPTKMPMLSAPPNLPPPPTLRAVQPAHTKALPGLSPNPSPITAIEGNSASASIVEAAVIEAVKTVEVVPVVAAVEVAAVVPSLNPVVAEVKVASKPLNAAAKEFKFNPSATAWTPPTTFKPPVAAVVPAPVILSVPQTPPQHQQHQQQQQSNFPPMTMSSPVQLPLNGGAGNVYNSPYPQQGTPSATGNNNNHNGNDYKSPAQLPIPITQSPSGGPMLMPAQPNFMPYQQIPPEFAMQFGLDPNMIGTPQQMPNGGQWLMPGVPGGPPFDPRGIPMMGYPQGFPVPQTAQEQQFLMQQGLVPPPIMMPDGQFMPPPWAMPMQAFGPPGEQGVGFPNPLMGATPQQIQAMMQGNQAMFMPQPGGFPGFMPMPQQGFHPNPQQQQQMMQQQQQQQQLLQQGNGQGNNSNNNAGGNAGGYNNNNNNNNNNYHRDNNNQGGGGGQNYNNKGYNERNNNGGGGRGGRGYNNNSGNSYNNRDRYNNNNSNFNRDNRDRNNNSQPGTPGGNNNRESREAHSNFAKEGSTSSSAAAASTGSPAVTATGGAGGNHEDSAASVGAIISAESASTPSK